MPLGLQMVDLGCQDTDWVGGGDRDLFEANLLLDGIILAALSVDNGKCGYIGYISAWFGVLRGGLRVTDGELGCQDTDWVGGVDRDLCRGKLSARRPHTSHFELGQRKMWSCWVHFWLVWAPEAGPLGHRWLIRVSGYRLGRWR